MLVNTIQYSMLEKQYLNNLIDNQIKQEIDDGIISAPTEDIPGSGGNL
jgi:hypothetical protein